MPISAVSDHNSESYTQVSSSPSDAPDESFRGDPVWGAPIQGRSYQPLNCAGIRSLVENVLESATGINNVTGITSIGETELNSNQPLREKCYGAIGAGLHPHGTGFKSLSADDLALDPGKTVDDLVTLICDDVLSE